MNDTPESILQALNWHQGWEAALDDLRAHTDMSIEGIAEYIQNIARGEWGPGGQDHD